MNKVASSRRSVVANPKDPEVDESLRGWVFRTAGEQGYKRLSSIEGLVGVPLSAMEDDSNSQAVSEVLGSTVEEVRLRSRRKVFIPGTRYRPALSKVVYFGHNLAEEHLHSDAVRICRACLGERQYLRGIWDLTLYGFCDRHRLRLVNDCPDQPGQLAYGRKSLLELSRLKSSCASEAAIIVCRFIRAAFERDASLEPFEHPDLRALSLAGRLNLLAVLTTGYSGFVAPTLESALRQWRAASVRQMESAYDRIVRLLTGWPAALETEISRSLQALPKGAAILKNIEAGIARWMGWELPEELEFIDRLVVGVIRDRWQHYVHEREKLGDIDIMTVPGTAGLADVIDQLGHAGAAAAEPCGPGEFVPVRDAADHLGTDTRTILQIFPTFYLSRKTSYNGKPAAPRVVLSAHVMGCRTLLITQNHPWVDEPVSQYLTFDEAKQCCSLLDVQVAAFVEVLLSGSVRMCKPLGMAFALSNNLINESDFCAWLSEVAQNVRSRVVRVDTARQLLRLNNPTLERLIAEGVLPFAPKESALDDRKVSLEVALGTMDKIRVLHRIEEFCGVPRSTLEGALTDAGGARLPVQTVGPSRQLRIALKEELMRPTIFALLKESAQKKWLRSDVDDER